jgi:hypothetical protein
MDDGCKATIVKGKRAGEVCGKTLYGDTDKCWGHQPKAVKDEKGFGGPQEGSGPPRRPRMSDMFWEVYEEKRSELRAAVDEALTAERAVVVGNGPTAHVELVPDHPTRLKALDMVADRTDGKPRQSVEMSGPEGSPITANLITDPSLAEAARDVLRRAATSSSD